MSVLEQINTVLTAQREEIERLQAEVERLQEQLRRADDLNAASRKTNAELRAEVERLNLLVSDNKPCAAAVPDGWKLVPVDATHEMAMAGVDAGVFAGSLGEKWFPAAYRAALAAAPQPLTAEPVVTVRYDLSPAMVECKIRDKLIEMGWTPPAIKPE